jgi:hypothetical protein
MNGILIPYGNGLLSHPGAFGGAYLAGGKCSKGQVKRCLTSDCVPKGSIPKRAKSKNGTRKLKVKKGNKFSRYIYSLMQVNPHAKYADLATDPNVKDEYQNWKLSHK